MIAAGSLWLYLSLESLNVLGLEALRALCHGKLYRLAFLQALESAVLDRREMHEDIVAGLTADKAEALCIIEPLHCSLFHRCYLCFIVKFLLRKCRCE